MVLLWVLWTCASALAKHEIERGHLFRGLASFVVSMVSVAFWIIAVLL
jgi:hypothetical protein